MCAFACVLRKSNYQMEKLMASEWACPWLRLKSELIRNEQRRKPLRWTGEREMNCSVACNHLNLLAALPLLKGLHYEPFIILVNYCMILLILLSAFVTLMLKLWQTSVTINILIQHYLSTEIC